MVFYYKAEKDGFLFTVQLKTVCRVDSFHTFSDLMARTA